MHRATIGELIVTEERDDSLGRHVSVAKLMEPGTGRLAEDLPPLRDVRLVRMGSDYMSLTGFERVRIGMDERDIEYAQSWILEPE